ncbi:MAG: hypothetical protein KC777_06660 [Cyanobacteria bacterium HKST-UBA02]|nr:hypothetical protein [Cyanobacteria bacterium HKST-UBA02]
MIRTASVLLVVSFTFGFVSGLALSYLEEKMRSFGSGGNKCYDAVLRLIGNEDPRIIRLHEADE